MSFLRSILAAFFFVAFAAGGVLIGLGLFPLCAIASGGAEIAQARRRCLVRAAYRLFVFGARVTGLFRVEVSPGDRQRLSALRGAVVVANHISLIDVVILIAHLGDATAVAKLAASRNPFYARIVKSVFLVNDDPVQVLDSAGRLISTGVNLVVFPEGTRMPIDGIRHRLHRGAAQMALAAAAPLEIVRITCDPPVLGKDQPWYDVGRRTITYSLQILGTVFPSCDLPNGLRSPESPGVSRHLAAVQLTAKISALMFSNCRDDKNQKSVTMPIDCCDTK